MSTFMEDAARLLLKLNAELEARDATIRELRNALTQAQKDLATAQKTADTFSDALDYLHGLPPATAQALCTALKDQNGTPS